MNRYLAGVVTVAATLLSASAQGATTVYSNLYGEAKEYSTGSAITQSAGGSIGCAFTATTTGFAYYAEVPLLQIGTGSPATTATFHLALADANGLPGLTIDNLGSMSSFTNYSGGLAGRLETFNSTLHPLLTAGVKYWLFADVTGANDLGWNQQYYQLRGNIAKRTGTGAWSNAGGDSTSGVLTGAFAVYAPEPATLSAIAGACLVITRRRRVAR